jgi:hypothetical protein
MQRAEPTPQTVEMGARMEVNFEPFIAHEILQIGGYMPDIDGLRSASTRIVRAAGEASEQQAARRAAFALAERLGLPVTYLPGSLGRWGSDPQEFAERLHAALPGRDVENAPAAPTSS